MPKGRQQGSRQRVGFAGGEGCSGLNGAHAARRTRARGPRVTSGRGYTQESCEFFGGGARPGATRSKRSRHQTGPCRPAPGPLEERVHRNSPEPALGHRFHVRSDPGRGRVCLLIHRRLAADDRRVAVHVTQAHRGLMAVTTIATNRRCPVRTIPSVLSRNITQKRRSEAALR